jgi:predicted RNA-binding Zn-ribbon protein involved in translation (DUF1610 family)
MSAVAPPSPEDGPPVSAEDAAAWRLFLLLACPHCGAPFVADDEQVSFGCAHCGSLLLLRAPERDEVYYAEGQVPDGAAVFEIVVAYRLRTHRAELMNRFRDAEGNPPPEMLIEMMLRSFEVRFRATARLLEAHRLHAPYWHVAGSLVQGILGRRGDGPKLVRLRAFAVEHTVPGYAEDAVNLRDRGLRLAVSRVRPLTIRAVEALQPFLPWVPAADRPYREIDKWTGRDLDPGTEATAKHGRFLFARRLLVYRPYWVAHIQTNEGQEWVLVDGSFGTLAGHPSEAEVRVLLDLGTLDPLGSEEPSYRRVQVIPSRCPDCGFEGRFDPHAHVSVCTNCHRALALEPGGVALVPCDHVDGDLDADYLPFWSFRFDVQMAGEAPVSCFEDYERALFPVAPPGPRPTGPRLFVPAFRLLGTGIGDQAFQRLVEWIHAASPPTVDSKVPLGGRPTFASVTVSEADAREIAPFVFFGLHSKAAAARLTTLLLRKGLQDARTTLRDPRLVWVPFERSGAELRPAGTSVRVPLLLLRGGRELLAQRATVQAPTASRA